MLNLQMILLAMLEIYGLNTKVKVGSSWETVQKIHVKNGGTWTQVKRAYGKVGASWETTYEYEWVYEYSTGEHLDQDIDLISGIDKFHNVRIVIPSGTTIRSSLATGYALNTGSGYGGALTIENAGSILGAGGNGGDGGRGDQTSAAGNAGQDGQDGGSAINIQSDVRIINTGVIQGGQGGGGGGGGALSNNSSSARAGGGAGGGGYPYGQAGAITYNTYGPGGQGELNPTAAANATLTSSGSGGLGGYANAQSGFGGGSYAWGGGPSVSQGVRPNSGGAGGVAGANGTSSHQSSYAGTGGAAGSTGATYYNPSNFTIS